MRVPRGLQELNVQLSRLIEELTVQLGRSPTIPELAKASGEEEEVLEALESGRAYSSCRSRRAGGGDDDDELDPLEMIGDRGALATRSPRIGPCSSPALRRSTTASA